MISDKVANKEANEIRDALDDLAAGCRKLRRLHHNGRYVRKDVLKNAELKIKNGVVELIAEGMFLQSAFDHEFFSGSNREALSDESGE